MKPLSTNPSAMADPASLGKVAVLMGGHSAEREVSLMSGTGVLAALQGLGVDAHAFDPATQPLAALKEQGFARCFIALHGRGGEDGTLQGALEWLRLPYTGPGVMASAVAMDKVMTKRVWQAEGLPTPRWVWLRAGQQLREELNAVPDAIGLPLIVKPPREGSSIGISKVQGYSQMQPAVALAAQFDADVLCEEFIEGIELTCPVLGAGGAAEALPVVRIEAPDGNYDFQNKYFTDVVRYSVEQGPGGLLTEAEQREAQRLTLAAYRVLGCRGWSRADLMLRTDPANNDRKLFLLEMNTSPGMTGHSLVPISAAAAGLPYAQLCLRILAGAALDQPAPSSTAGAGSSHGGAA